LKKNERKDDNPFPRLRSILTREREVDERGVDLLQVLIEAGLEIEAESLRLSLQTKHIKSIAPVPPQEKKLVDAKVAAIKKVESWIEKMLSEQPIIASSAALIWLGHDHCRRNQDEPGWERPDWVVIDWNNGVPLLDPTPLHEDSIRKRLQSCLDFAPANTIQAMTFASVMYEVIFSQPSLFNSIGRLESFFKKMLPSWRQHTIKSNDLQRIITRSNTLYLKKVIGTHSQVYSFILSSLELFFRAPVKDRNALETIISNWPKIVSADEKFFAKYENVHILYSAAREALSDDKLRNKLKIAEKIDSLTNQQHTNLSSRLKIYQKIDRLYTARQTTQKPATEPVGVSLSVAELDTLDQLCDDQRLYQQDAVSTCINHAYNESKKGKKYVKSKTNPFFPPMLVRHPIKKTTLRLSPASRQRLTSLTRNLNKHKLVNGKVFSASTALGLAIHLYARSLRPNEVSYKGATLPHDGLPAGLLIGRDKAQTAVKRKLRKRDIGQSHAIRPKVPAKTKNPKGALETGSAKAANQSTQAKTAQEPQPATIDQPTTQSHPQPEATEHSQAAPSEQLHHTGTHSEHSEPGKSLGSTGEAVEEHCLEPTKSTDEDQLTPTSQPSRPPKQQQCATERPHTPTPKNSSGSSTEASAAVTVTEAHEEPDTQTTQERSSLPANQPDIQNTAAQAPVESNLSPQQASTALPDGEPEESQENKVAAKAASEETHPQDSGPPEARKELQKDPFEQRGSRSDYQDVTASSPSRRPRSGRNDFRPSSWDQIIKNKEKRSNKWQDE
tara:strand:+ start:2552 stop:4903 length:2352 start_codon:yes stop_codon:yes gene_type:complete